MRYCTASSAFSVCVRQVITARSHGLPLYLDLSVARFLELHRVGRTPQPVDFDHDFPALVARTLSDLTPDERHVLRSVSLLDAFDVPLATRAVGLAHEGPALRLTERPFVREDPFGLWPFHLHGLIRSAVRNADATTDDRWSERDWHQAAQRALTTLGDTYQNAPGPDRLLLIACLRQGLRLARDHRLALDWLTPAAWTYISDSIWEPLAPPDTGTDTDTGLSVAADALVELLSALDRRQHEHRSRTAARLTAVVDSRLLPDDLQHMALYYRAKAHRDLGDSAASQAGMQTVADGDTRLAPAARRGLAHLAHLARTVGGFPTALAIARNLGWEGRHHRVEGDPGGPTATWTARPSRTPPHATKPNSTGSPANATPARPSAPSPSPSPTPRPPTATRPRKSAADRPRSARHHPDHPHRRPGPRRRPRRRGYRRPRPSSTGRHPNGGRDLRRTHPGPHARLPPRRRPDGHRDRPAAGEHPQRRIRLLQRHRPVHG
ncbi:hypothetical protein [Streptomyces sp. Qhu-G9]|uniref:hypothetical protein n=1 Tax=Streptomyces sp. Qhu-G9 TaxID=3452799 RepID=UPI002F2B258E